MSIYIKLPKKGILSKLFSDKLVKICIEVDAKLGKLIMRNMEKDKCKVGYKDIIYNLDLNQSSPIRENEIKKIFFSTSDQTIYITLGNNDKIELKPCKLTEKECYKIYNIVQKLAKYYRDFLIQRADTLAIDDSDIVRLFLSNSFWQTELSVLPEFKIDYKNTYRTIFDSLSDYIKQNREINSKSKTNKIVVPKILA